MARLRWQRGSYVLLEACSHLNTALPSVEVQETLVRHLLDAEDLRSNVDGFVAFIAGSFPRFSRSSAKVLERLRLVNLLFMSQPCARAPGKSQSSSFAHPS